MSMNKKNECIINGYTESNLDVLRCENSKKILRCILELDLPKCFEYDFIFDRDILNLKEQTNEFLNILFPGLNKIINYVNEEDFILLYTKLKSKNPDSETLENELNSIISITKTDDVPVVLDTRINYTSLNSPFFSINNDEFLEKHPIVFSKITLGQLSSSKKETLLAHEIVHMLVNRNKFVINDYLDKEFLSLFIEKVITYEFLSNEETYKFELNRLIEIQNIDIFTLLDEKYNEPQAYYNGQLLATQLMYKYENMNEQDKKTLFFNIQKVLEGCMLLKEFYALYNLSIENPECYDAMFMHIYKLTSLNKTRK